VKVCPKCFTEVEDVTRFCPNCGEAVPTQQQKDEHGLLGKTVAEKYVVLELIGEGAMGSIYRAEQVALGKTVCIKVLHPHLTGDVTLSKRFHREARAASRIKHPNAINIIDFGTASEGTHYIAMDFIDGMDLAHLLKKEFPLHPTRIIHITDQICSALDEAHAQGIVHRDLKPENIMVEDRRHQKDFVTVLDFGIAKIRDPGRESPDTFHTMAGIVCGTPEYMSPEQARGEVLDARADIYSLGIILYQLATGKLPFTGDTPIGVVTKHLTVEPAAPRQVNPQVHAGLEQVILRLIAKDKNIRPANCLEVKNLLKEVRRQIEREDDSLTGTAPMARPSPEELARMAEAPKSPTARFDKNAADPERSESADDMENTAVSQHTGISSGTKMLIVLLVLAVLGVAGWFGYQQYVSEVGGPQAQPQAKASEPDAARKEERKVEAKKAEVAPLTAGKKQAAPPEVDKKAEEAKQQQLLAKAAGLTAGLQQRKAQYDTQCEKLKARQIDWKTRKRDDKAEEAGRLVLVCEEGGTRVALALDSATKGQIEEAEKASKEEESKLSEFTGKAAVLLAEQLPPLEDVQERQREQLTSLSGNITATRALLAERAKQLESKQADWMAAGQKAKADEVAALATQTSTLAKELETLQAALAVDKLDEQVAEYAKADGRHKLLAPDVQKALSETVVLSPEVAAKRKAEEEKKKAEEKKKKEEAEAKKKAEEEKKAKAEEADRKKAEEAAKKEEAKAKAESLVKLGDEAVEGGNYAKAIAYYKESLSLSPSANLHKKLGQAYNSQGNYAKGAEHLKTYLKLMEGKLSPVQVELIKKQIRE
jgi:serine/threonine-protein kinase